MTLISTYYMVIRNKLRDWSRFSSAHSPHCFRTSQELSRDLQHKLLMLYSEARDAQVSNALQYEFGVIRMKVLAVSSGGGHWIELLRVVPAFGNASLVYVTVRPDYRKDIQSGALHVVRDATQWNPIGAAILAVQVLYLIVRIRPDIVVSTGAAPGYFAIRFGKLFGAHTIWIDSLANVERLSKAGLLAGRYADLWLTQWPDLARSGGPDYAGQVI